MTCSKKRESCAMVDRSSHARHIFSLSGDVDGSEAETYLRGRCIYPLPKQCLDVRYHPNLDARPTHSESGKKFRDSTGAVIFAVRNVFTFQRMAIQRRFLNGSGGKYPHILKSMSLGQCSQGAFMASGHIVQDNAPLVICEGVEDALSAAQFGFKNSWAVLGTSGLSRFPILSSVSELIIVADNDAAGIEAAITCTRRWQDGGVKASFFTLKHDKDLNACLMRKRAMEAAS